MEINKKYLMNNTINQLNQRMYNREYDLIENDDNFSVYPINLIEKVNLMCGKLVKRHITTSLILLLTITTLQAQDQDRKAVTSTLDALHLYAHEADGKKYFSLYSDDAVFMGTDATERWHIGEFKTYANARFDTGKGWTYTPTSRNIYFNENRDTAWFDETVMNVKYGECRGTGVLEKFGGEWKISHYNLTVPVPNDLLVPIVEMIKGQKKSK